MSRSARHRSRRRPPGLVSAARGQRPGYPRRAQGGGGRRARGARADGGVDEEIAQTRNRIAALMGAGPDRGLAHRAAGRRAVKAFGLPAGAAGAAARPPPGHRRRALARRGRRQAHRRRTRAVLSEHQSRRLHRPAGAVRAICSSRPSSQIGSVGPAVTLADFRGRPAARAVSRRAGRLRRWRWRATTRRWCRRCRRSPMPPRASARSARGSQQSRAALAADEEAYRLTRMRYEGGLSNYQSVLIAEDAVLQARAHRRRPRGARFHARCRARAGPGRRLRRKLMTHSSFSGLLPWPIPTPLAIHR